MKTNKLRSAAALLLVLALTLPSVFAASAGEPVWQTTTRLADGLTYTDTVSLHPTYGREALYSLTLSPDSAVYPIVLTGDSTVYGGATISGAVSRAEALGYHVLGAVNGDFFSLSTRVPVGLVIEDGVYKSSADGRAAVAFREDGSAFFSTPDITITLTNNGGSYQAYNTGSSVTLSHLNKTRGESGLYLYNDQFSTVSTRTDTAGWMVLLKVTGEDDTLTLNSTLSLVVEDIFYTDGTQYPHAQSIGDGYYILTAAQAAGLDGERSKFANGDRVTLTVTCSDPELTQAKWACGGGDILAQEGALTDSTLWDSSISAARHPRTLVGIHADGTLQLTAVDGRRSSHSNGLSLKLAAQELLEQGCVSVLNLDGGGSTAMAVQTPGQERPVVVNTPSDGSLRRCATYLLLVTDPPPAAEEPSDPAPVEQLYLAQNGGVVFAGSSIDLSQVYAVDTDLYRTDAPADTVLTTEGQSGTLKGTTYTASTPGVETITLISPSTGAAGTAQIYVVDALTALSVSRSGETAALTALSPQAGEEVSLTVSGLWNGLPVTLQSLQATWSVTGKVGAVTQNGLFTAGRFSGAAGTVEVTCGGVTHALPVTLPIGFMDTDDSWAKDFILKLANQGIVGGTNTETGTMYYPGNNITRQEFFIMLCNLLKADPAAYADVQLPFADAAQIPSWSVNYIKALYALGYVGGSLGSDGLLYSNYANSITRAEIAVMLGQFLTVNEGFSPVSFSDQDQIPAWALPGMLNAVSNGLMGGYEDGTIRPTAPATRAEVAVMLCNFQPLLEAALSQPADGAQTETPGDAAQSELPSATEGTDPLPAENG